jgi:hypothetical protein
MATRMRMTFVDEGISAVVVLLEKEAPKTCAAIIAALPQEGEAFHAMYSGSANSFALDRDLGIGPENSTTRVLPGDVAFKRFEGGELWGFPDDLCEILWYYDRDAVPSMPDGPVPVNLFGRFVEGFDEFAVACKAMRRTGIKRLRVTLE